MLEAHPIHMFAVFRKSDELAFVRISENDEEPNDQLDPERVQDFAANASYFKVSRFPGTLRGQ